MKKVFFEKIDEDFRIFLNFTDLIQNISLFCVMNNANLSAFKTRQTPKHYPRHWKLKMLSELHKPEPKILWPAITGRCGANDVSVTEMIWWSTILAFDHLAVSVDVKKISIWRWRTVGLPLGQWSNQSTTTTTEFLNTAMSPPMTIFLS